MNKFTSFLAPLIEHMFPTRSIRTWNDASYEKTSYYLTGMLEPVSGRCSSVPEMVMDGHKRDTETNN
jgi:hypothetical protein